MLLSEMTLSQLIALWEDVDNSNPRGDDEREGRDAFLLEIAKEIGRRTPASF